MKKKYLVNYKFVQIDPKLVSLVNLSSGTYNLTLNEMLQKGGVVIFQGSVQVDAAPNFVFFTSRFKAQQALNNAILGGSITQNPMLASIFVMTNAREMTETVKSKTNFSGNSWDWA
jgi:hypothetical protein